MKNFIRNFFAVLAVMFVASHAAFAKVSVPEIDPSMGAGALALLGGAIMVIRGRSKK
jgi:uncharacterized membrane protein